MTGFIKTLALTLALMITCSLVQAQRGDYSKKSPEERAEQQTAKMAESLSLSDGQVEKIKAVNIKYAKMASEARENAGEDRSAMRETMRANREAQKAEINTYLTAEQAEKWTKLEAERRENRGKKGGKKGKKGKKKGKKMEQNIDKEAPEGNENNR